MTGGVLRGGARDRELSALNQLIFSVREPLLEQNLDAVIASRGTPAKRPTRVLEIGFGEGTALLEFAWQFRDKQVDFYGIDAAVGPEEEITVRSQEDLRGLPARYEHLREIDVEQLALPEVAFYAIGEGTPQELTTGQARGIDLSDNSIDLVYSVATIRFVTDKIRLIEEVVRILAPGGTAFLDVDDVDWDYSAAAADGTFDLDSYRGRLLLLAGEAPVPIPIYFGVRGGSQVTFRFPPARRLLLTITKNDDRPFSFGVRYDHRHSLKTHDMPRRPNGRLIGGVRSAYQAAPRIIETMTFPWQQRRP